MPAIRNAAAHGFTDYLHSYCGDMPPKEFEEIYYKALESGKIRDSSQT